MTDSLMHEHMTDHMAEHMADRALQRDEEGRLHDHDDHLLDGLGDGLDLGLGEDDENLINEDDEMGPGRHGSGGARGHGMNMAGNMSMGSMHVNENSMLAGMESLDGFNMDMKTKKSKQLKLTKQKNQDAAKTRAARAGLVFPVARIHSKLKNMVPAHCRVGGTAAVFLAAVVEYLVAELCELAGNKAKKSGRIGGGPDDVAGASGGGTTSMGGMTMGGMTMGGNTSMGGLTVDGVQNQGGNQNAHIKKKKSRINPR